MCIKTVSVTKRPAGWPAWLFIHQYGRLSICVSEVSRLAKDSAFRTYMPKSNSRMRRFQHIQGRVPPDGLQSHSAAPRWIQVNAVVDRSTKPYISDRWLQIDGQYLISDQYTRSDSGIVAVVQQRVQQSCAHRFPCARRAEMVVQVMIREVFARLRMRAISAINPRFEWL